jgi:hypothetical protein
MRDSILAGFVLSGICAALAIPEPSNEIPTVPGAIASTDFSEVCAPGYSRNHRQDSYTLRESIRARDHCGKDSQVDHRVPLSLGGKDSPENLWCQPGNTTWNYKDKDKLEVFMWVRTCKQKEVSLETAQKMFLGDWRKGYCEVFYDRRC